VVKNNPKHINSDIIMYGSVHPNERKMQKRNDAKNEIETY
jgi:hypothetical protein